MREQIRQAYLSGKSVSEIADETKIDPAFVYRMVQDILRDWSDAVALANGGTVQ